MSGEFFLINLKFQTINSYRSIFEGEAESVDAAKKWSILLASDYWRLPPNWTQVGTKKKGIWTRIRNIPKKIYAFLVVRISYEDYFASQLRSRYMDLVGRFRNSLPVKPEDQDLSDFIKELLILSKLTLEQEKLGKMDLISTSSQLDRVEERMVWILPKDIKISKIHEIILDLDRFKADTKANYEKLLLNCQEHLEDPNFHDNDSCNANIEEIVRAINKDILDKRINNGLQIERLRSLRFWGLVLLSLYIFLFPMVGKFDYYTPYTDLSTSFRLTLNDTIPKGVLDGMTQLIGGWAVALGFAIVGGIGGFLSGLLQVRTSETNLELYEEAVLLFQIRPIFGAFAALVMFMLISLGALSSVFSTGEGSMALAAFLSGFSERYFLKLLKAEPDSKDKDKEPEPKDKDKDRGGQPPAAGELQGQGHNGLSSGSAGQASTEQP